MTTEIVTVSRYVLLSWRQRLWERDSGLCGICHEPVAFDRNMHIDHLVPLSLGGTHDDANLQVTHGRCNSLKGPHPGTWKRHEDPPAVVAEVLARIETRLTVCEVAMKLCVKPKTIRKWIKLGTIKRATMVNRRAGWLIPSAEVDRLLRSKLV